jgi:hypothetical protein
VHIVTLSFDDGFERSSLRTIEIFERHGLAAELNVIAAGHRGKPDETWHTAWPLPLGEAQRLIERCLEVFAAELEGFEASESSFAFPYNRSNAALEAWLCGQVRAFRTGGEAVMPLPRAGQQRVTCVSFGPERCDEHLVHTIDSFLAGSPGWLCYNLHGLDDEGWGPVGSSTLDRLLERLIADGVQVLPIAAALDLAAAACSTTAGVPGNAPST